MFKSASALFTMFITAAVLFSASSPAHAYINVTDVQDVPNLLDSKADEPDCDHDHKSQTASDEDKDKDQGSKTRRQRRRAKEAVTESA